MEKQIWNILLLVILIPITTSNMYSQEQYMAIQTENLNLNINPSIEINISEDYTISPKEIKLQHEKDITIASGESFIIRYDITNKLNQTLQTKLLFNIDNNINQETYDIYLAKDSKEKECTNILKYNSENIEIYYDWQRYILCDLKGNYTIEYGTITLNTILNPGINHIYFLFKTKPNIPTGNYQITNTFLIQETNQTENNNVPNSATQQEDIKNTEPIYEPNYDDDVNNSTLLPTINENIDNNKTQIPENELYPEDNTNKPSQIKDENIDLNIETNKNKITGAFTLKKTNKIILIIASLLIVSFIIYGIIEQKKQKKERL